MKSKHHYFRQVIHQANYGGTTKHPSIAETSEKKREYMKSHPEQFRPMLEGSKKAFCSGDTPALRARSRRIKEVMSTDEYRKMTAARLKKWREQNPLMYAAARRKNHAAIKTTECREKRTASLKKWISENPEKHIVWEENRLKALRNKESKERRKASLKGWRDENPEQAKANAHKRAKAAAAKLSKEVNMIDLYCHCKFLERKKGRKEEKNHLNLLELIFLPYQATATTERLEKEPRQ